MKMAMKRKADGGNGEQFKFETIGQSLKGIYVGSQEITGQYGPSIKHLFKTEKGLKAVFGQTHLTQLLQGEEGKLVEATYVKDKPSKRGRPMKSYTLDIDTDYQASSEELAAYAGDDEPVEDDEDVQPDEVKTEQVKRSVSAAAPSAASRDRVKALLNGRAKTNA